MKLIVQSQRLMVCAVALFGSLKAVVGEPPYIGFAPIPHSLALVQARGAAPILASTADWPGVIRAATDLQKDVERVSGVRPELLHEVPKGRRNAIMVGTLGRSPWIDHLVALGKLDASAIRGKWESWITQVVAAPVPGIDQALVIVGSDKRGTIFGIYDLSDQMGVSPWYWWADVVPGHHPGIYASAGCVVHGPPAVKYRGIFLNDEAPDLTGWVREKFGTAARSLNPPVPPGVANYGHQFYARIFELLLRLRANCLWPAMWDNAFNEDDPENARLADESGIVMGTSHQEPMLRSQQEWDRRYHATVGAWNYYKVPGLLEDFWRDGIRRNRSYESIITLGLRGENDTAMAPGGPEANQALLERIVARQRQIIRSEMPGAAVPQVWCLYKEVLQYYEHGMRVPDDVTLLWSDDNWGDLCRVPTQEERRRPGGSGIYYHFDYHGAPRSYQWINSNPLPKIWDQMSLAYQAGADRVWIVNVGHFKGYEIPTEFFLDLAWSPERWREGKTDEFLTAWAAREFGAEHAADIARLAADDARFNGRRKPELLGPKTYSLVDYHESDRVLADFAALESQARLIGSQLPPSSQAAYYQLVLFPIAAGATLNQLYAAAGRDEWYAQQERASTGKEAAAAWDAFARLRALLEDYNRRWSGRWDHFMDQPVLGYTSWRDPPTNSLRHIELIDHPSRASSALGVAVEGSSQVWPDSAAPAVLPEFDRFNRQTREFEVFRRGAQAFSYRATASAPWIILSEPGGAVADDRRVAVHIDWPLAPVGRSSGAIRIAAAGRTVEIEVSASNPLLPVQGPAGEFVESDGVVSIEAGHFARQTGVGAGRWTRVAGYGHTLSGMRAEGPLASSFRAGRDAPCLQYDLLLFHKGALKVIATLGPTLNVVPSKPVRYAVAFDDEPPTVVTVVPADFVVHFSNRQWTTAVADNAFRSATDHRVRAEGSHTLKIWEVDPGVVLEKIVVDAGGLRTSYLGPPESFRRR